MIPQDSKLFIGTIRQNLDPENQCSDEEILDLMEEAGLKDLITNKMQDGDETSDQI